MLHPWAAWEQHVRGRLEAGCLLGEPAAQSAGEVRSEASDRRRLYVLLARATLASLTFTFLLSTTLSVRGAGVAGEPTRHGGGSHERLSVIGAEEIVNGQPNVFLVRPTDDSPTQESVLATTTTITTTSVTTVTTTATTWTTTSVSTSVTPFYKKPAPVDFPEIMYLMMPESTEDHKRYFRMKSEIIRYLPPQRWGVRVIPAVVPELWPEGRYDRVEHFGRMLPVKEPADDEAEAHKCIWNEKAEGSLYAHYYGSAPAHSLVDCREACCKDPKCRAIRFSPSAVDGLDLQCLLYPRGEEAWSLDLPLYEDYRVHLFEDDAEGRELAPDVPWWQARNLEMARVWPGNRFPTFDANGERPAHHVGCSLSHFSMWMDALSRGVNNLIIFESDGYPSCLDCFDIGGNGSDFAELVGALPSRAPPDWHLIVLNKGTQGARPGAPPVAVIPIGSSQRVYTMIPWKGLGVAGAQAYMVSKRFLEYFPTEIQNRGLVMVDSWIGWKCSDKSPQNPNPINCYSFVRSS